MPDNGAFLSFSARDAGLHRAVRDLRGRYQSGNQAMLRVNQRTIAYLKGASAEILRQNIKREKDHRNKIGLGVVSDDGAHTVSTDKFRFWVLDKVRGIDERVSSYYRAIDEGSDYWVGRYAALVFIGNPVRPAPGGGRQAGYVDRRGTRVLISNPVPAYGFLSNPVADFRSQGLYAQYVRDEFKELRIPVKVNLNP